MTHELAVPIFHVGDWTVIPARRLIRAGEREVTLEPRVMDCLICLAERDGDVVSHDQLVADVWHGTIVSDSPVYQTMAKLRKALGDDTHHPRYVETIPKRGYRLIADVDWPKTAVPAKASEADLARDDDPDAAPTAKDGIASGERPAAWPSALGRSRFMLVMTVLVATLFVFLGTSDVATTSPDRGDGATSELSIAILPFVDMSEDGRRGYLGDGIAEQLIHTLSGLPELRVISRTSSFAFRNSDLDVVSIADRLNVRLVLEGSIRTAGDQIRVNAQLIDGHDAFHVWSRTFEQPVGDIFDIQDAIAREVARLIIGDSANQSDNNHIRYATHDTRAWELYLYGLHQMQMRRSATLARAIEYFEEAVAVDPNFALAYAKLSFTYFLSSDERFGDIPNELALEQADDAAHSALSIDSRLAEAWLAVGAVLHVTGDEAGAMKAAERAYALKPGSAEVNKVYSRTLSLQGREEDGLAALERAVALDPLAPVYRQNLAAQLERQGRHQEAYEQIQKSMEIDPGWHASFSAGSRMAYFRGELDRAVSWGITAATVEGPDARWAAVSAWRVADAWLSLGDFEAARAWLLRAEESGKPKWWTDFIEIQILLAEYRDAEAHELLQRWAGQILYEKECCTWTAMLNSHADAFAFAALTEMILGHDGHAIALFDESRTPPGSGQPDDFPMADNDLLAWGYLPAVSRALLYLRSGQREIGEALLARSMQFLEDIADKRGVRPGVLYAMASAQVLQGEARDATGLIDTAIDEGWYRAWYARRDPVIAPLLQEPAFLAALERVDEKLAQQRQALLAQSGLLDTHTSVR